MNMPIFGTLHNAMKMMELKHQWQERRKDPTAPKGDPRDIERENMYRQLEDIRRSNTLQSIDAKLNTGTELTTEELSYLRTHAPEKYQEVLQLKEEREAYKRDLKNCKTKDDVQRLQRDRLQSYATQVKVISQNPNIPLAKKLELAQKIQKRVMAVQTEHQKYVKTEQFKNLPTQEELDKEALAKAKEKSQAAEPDVSEDPVEDAPNKDTNSEGIQPEDANATESESARLAQLERWFDALGEPSAADIKPADGDSHKAHKAPETAPLVYGQNRQVVNLSDPPESKRRRAGRMRA